MNRIRSQFGSSLSLRGEGCLYTPFSCHDLLPQCTLSLFILCHLISCMLSDKRRAFSFKDLVWGSTITIVDGAKEHAC